MNAWDSTSSKVCADNCYYLISTIWKEAIIIRGFDWDVKRRETNVCFVALYTFVFLRRWKCFRVPSSDEILVSGAVPAPHLGKYPCVPPSSELISHPSELKQCPALKTRDGRLKLLDLYLQMCLHNKLLKMNYLVFQKTLTFYKVMLMWTLHKRDQKQDYKLSSAFHVIFFFTFDSQTWAAIFLWDKSLVIFFFFLIRKEEIQTHLLKRDVA